MKREEHKEEHKESILRAISISIKPSVKTTIKTYQEMKGHLSDYYDAFVADPLSFGVPHELADEITSMNSLKAKGLWVLFKQQFKLKLLELEQRDLAELLNQDLAEDGVSVVSKEALKMILKNPGKAEYHLEPEMIEAIQSMNSSERDELMKATASLYKIELGESVGHKILSFLKGLWTKLAPVFEKIFSSLIDHGIDKLGDVMVVKLPSDVSDGIRESLADIGHEATKITPKTVGGLIDDGLAGRSALATLEEGAQSLSGVIVKEVGEAVDHSSSSVIGLVVAQLEINQFSASSAHLVKEEVGVVSPLRSSAMPEVSHSSSGVIDDGLDDGQDDVIGQLEVNLLPIPPAPVEALPVVSRAWGAMEQPTDLRSFCCS
jgi:hypothetical protein